MWQEIKKKKKQTQVYILNERDFKVKLAGKYLLTYSMEQSPSWEANQ